MLQVEQYGLRHQWPRFRDIIELSANKSFSQSKSSQDPWTRWSTTKAQLHWWWWPMHERAAMPIIDTQWHDDNDSPSGSNGQETYSERIHKNNNLRSKNSIAHQSYLKVFTSLLTSLRKGISVKESTANGCKAGKDFRKEDRSFRRASLEYKYHKILSIKSSEISDTGFWQRSLIFISKKASPVISKRVCQTYTEDFRSNGR